MKYNKWKYDKKSTHIKPKLSMSNGQADNTPIPHLISDSDGVKLAIRTDP